MIISVAIAIIGIGAVAIAIVTRIEEGRILEDWEYYDSATIMSQLGLGAGQA